ncbi:MAG: amino acid transporter, partial [Phormidesmis sp. CAN_BIN44]|nr:amino acid transporter [Phormidesmis sp. CAN_BIN44]
MARPIRSTKQHRRQIAHWLLKDDRAEKGGRPHQHSWWQVMCLTGVDYFSTLGYQPGIAALAAGSLSPIATLILVLLTLFGALPIYRRVAEKSPHGEGSIAMLEHLLPWWQGKLFVLCLLGFVATDFIITITLSAADATAHIVENPLTPAFLNGQEIAMTLLLVALLGAVFLRGFREAIGLAVVLVGVYLLLNFVVVGVGFYQISQQPSVLTNWQTALFTEHQNPLAMIGVSMLLFPRLALGLSGFETGVVVMPLVKGHSSDTEERPRGRIQNTHKLLTIAAIIMSFFLITTSLITTLLIPAAEFQTGGKASGRALAYLAHLYLGNGFGTVYDLSTIAILWFAGASAMAGLLNIVPRYLPRYGMAPNWARATRPLVLVYTAIAFVITILFRANVEAQGGAYATGVLVLITSASFAVTLSARHRRSRHGVVMFGAITLVFIYTTVVNIIERPEGIRIAAFFIGAIVLTSLVSRVWRSTELRVEQIELDDTARRFIAEESQHTIRLIANR